MEVEVLDHTGLSSESIVMIHAGQIRRQAKLNAGVPYQFPSLPSNANPFRVEVFQPLGSKSMSLSSDALTYRVRVPGVREADRSMLELLIQDAKPVNSTQGADGLDSIGRDVPLDGECGVDPEEKKARAAASARHYLQKHDLVNFVQQMMAQVLNDKPLDPYSAMSAHAGRHDKGEEQWSNDANAVAVCTSRDSKVEDAGQDDDNFGVEAVSVNETTRANPSLSEHERDDLVDSDAWFLAAPQQALEVHGENCTLTILQNDRLGHLRFELHQPSINDNLFAVCTKQQFDDLCDEVGGFGSEQVNRAIVAMFAENFRSDGKEAATIPSVVAGDTSTEEAEKMLTEENERLAHNSDALRAEIERLRNVLGEDLKRVT
jgi:hypothetical protein